MSGDPLEGVDARLDSTSAPPEKRDAVEVKTFVGITAVAVEEGEEEGADKSKEAKYGVSSTSDAAKGEEEEKVGDAEFDLRFDYTTPKAVGVSGDVLGGGEKEEDKEIVVEVSGEKPNDEDGTSYLAGMNVTDVQKVAMAGVHAAEKVAEVEVKEVAKTGEAVEGEVVNAAQAAMDDWDQVTKQRDEEDAKKKEMKEKGETPVKSMKFPEVEDYFLRIDTTGKGVHVENDRGCIGKMCGTRLVPSLVDERRQLFGLAKTPFSEEDETHLKCLQAIYKLLLGGSMTAPRFGGHWEEIGFQNTDPATDLRGVGILGLLFLHYLSSKQSESAHQIWRLSKHEEQNFPMAVVSLNLTRVTLEAIRTGKLHANFNQEESVFQVAYRFYAGLFFEMYRMWKSNHYSIENFHTVLQDLTRIATTRPRDVFASFEKGIRIVTEKEGQMGEVSSA